MISAGLTLRQRVHTKELISLVGVFDVFSASLAAQAQVEGIFVSGFGLAASSYGMPDHGFVAWPDVVDLTRRLKAVVPHIPIVVDIDDGFSDSGVAAHVAKQLEIVGAAGLVLEDQARPRKCGHLGNKVLLPLSDYLERLDRVRNASDELFVIARTDATEESEILERVSAFSATSADAILVDGQTTVERIVRLRELTEKPLVFNQILGGKSAAIGVSQLQAAGVSISILSTPLLFAAQAAMQQCLTQLLQNDMRLDAVDLSVRLPEIQAVLMKNQEAAETRVKPRDDKHLSQVETNDVL